MRVASIIVAGGTGTRAGLFPPKQYQKIGAQTILEMTVNKFVSHPAIDLCAVVISKEHEELFNTKVAPNISGKCEVTFGGKSRTESVFCGLKHLSDYGIDHVLIHDAARPFVSEKLISKMVKSLETNQGVIPTLSIADAVWKLTDINEWSPVPRDGLEVAQTPQGFHFESIYRAYQEKKGNAADCAEIAISDKMNVSAMEGEIENFKITTARDLERARRIAMKKPVDVRVGQGLDVHRFEPGDSIKLCGITIPFNKSLKGHSDADVGLHAITDAIYGALGKGDIGTWFPPENPEWKNSDSIIFLLHANELINKESFMIASIDCTFVCEEPKIKPYAIDMRTKLADNLDISIDRISIKATTSELLGFTGRKEGILAAATVTLIR